MQYSIGDIVKMKEPHTCGCYEWEIIRTGTDFKIKCCKCKHIDMLSRAKLDEGIKESINHIQKQIDDEYLTNLNDRGFLKSQINTQINLSPNDNYLEIPITMLELEIASIPLAHGIKKIEDSENFVFIQKEYNKEFDQIFRFYQINGNCEAYNNAISCFENINNIMSTLKGAKEIIIEKGNVSKRYFKVYEKRHYHWCLEVTCNGQKLPAQGAFKNTKQLINYIPHLNGWKVKKFLTTRKIEKVNKQIPLNKDKSIDTTDSLGRNFYEKYKGLSLQNEKRIQILPQKIIISELLMKLAKEINASEFYAAVGFVFLSGLEMLYPTLKYLKDNNGNIEIISGSLQYFDIKDKNTKIDKKTVGFLNKLISDFSLNLYTYRESFYHGKFYYLSSSERAYVLIGSSNISKTAFLENYELNILYTIDVNSEYDNQFIKWYNNFKSQCISIDYLDIDKYEDFIWDSELDIYSSSYIHKISHSEVNNKISELSDEDTKFRFNLWMNNNPSEIFKDLGIKALSDYIVFLYEEHGLAVFESFMPGNAYYIFRCYDFEQLLKNISPLTKSEIALSKDLINRQYHISDKEKLSDKITKLFA